MASLPAHTDPSPVGCSDGRRVVLRSQEHRKWGLPRIDQDFFKNWDGLFAIEFGALQGRILKT